MVLEHLNTRNWESALLELFPIINRTANRRYPQEKGDGKKIKGYISAEEGLISYLATGSVWVGNVFEDMTLPELIYSLARNGMIHNRELDVNLEFHRKDTSYLGNESLLSDRYIFGLLMSVVFAAENRFEILPDNYCVRLLGVPCELNKLWGKRESFISRVHKVTGLNLNTARHEAHTQGAPVGTADQQDTFALDVRAIRTETGLTQADFARCIGVKKATLVAWEQSSRTPEGPARALLALIAREPGIVHRMLS